MARFINTHFYEPLKRVLSVTQTNAPAGGEGSTHSVPSLLLQTDAEQIRLDVIRPDILRVKVSRGGVFDDAPTYAISYVSAPEPAPFEWTQTDEELTLTTSAMTVKVDKTSFNLTAYRADGSLICEGARDRKGNSIYYQFLNDRWCVTRRIGPRDMVFGLGEKAATTNRRGRDYQMWNVDVLAGYEPIDPNDLTTHGTSTVFDPYYMTIPFFYTLPIDAGEGSGPGSAKMAGFYVDNGYHGFFEFSDDRTYRFEFKGGQYTEYLFADPTMKGILQAYTWLTGRMSPPPMWSLGMHQCRWHVYTDKQTLQIAENYRSKDIPCDVLWLDIDYMDEFRVFTWNKDRFPDPQGLFAKLKDMGLRVITIIDPGVKHDPGWKVYDEGAAMDGFCRTEDGQMYIGEVWPGRTCFPDFVKPEVRQWWGRLNAEHVKFGLAGIWNDMNEPATGKMEAMPMRFDYSGKNWPHGRYHNQYAMLMAMGTAEGLDAALPDQRRFILSRAGFAGIQRYAANWMGDNMSRWDHLGMSITMGCGVSISGQPFIGADLAGFGEATKPELMVRWFQQGVFAPFFRNHNMDAKDQYPWSFGPTIERLVREAIEERYRLMPYIYTRFMESARTGEAIQRPMVYDFQDEPAVYEADDQYLFGPDLLVAPILQAGQTLRRVYLPQGEWYAWHNKARMFKGGPIEVAAPMSYIPVFARAGAVIPTFAQAPKTTMGLAPESIDLHAFVPRAEGEYASVLHEDDGLSFAVQRGAFLRTDFTLIREGDRLKLRAEVSGAGYPEFKRKSFRLFLHGLNAPNVKVNGESMPLKDNLWLDLPNTGEAFEIESVVSG